MGAALLAAVGLGRYPSVEAVKPAIQVSRLVEPQSAHQAVYTDLYAAFRQVYPALRAIYQRLNASKRV